MAYEIVNVEYHKAEIAKIGKRQAERYERYRGDDTAMSDWADGTISRFHSFAIHVLENGGREEFCELHDSEGNAVDAKAIEGQYGMVWLLSDAAAKVYGRRFVPMGERSRVQKQLGLHEEWVMKPVSRWVRAHCGFVGGATTFYCEELRDPKDAIAA